MGAGRPPTREPNPGVVGANVRRLRAERRWSQELVAKRSGLSRSTVARAELGTYKSTDTTTVESLARAFEVPLAEILEPFLEGTEVHPLIEEFQRSPWFETLGPTDQELEWLRSLPDVVWTGARPTPETVARILQWHRDTAQ